MKRLNYEFMMMMMMMMMMMSEIDFHQDPSADLLLFLVVE